jgi:hypothetical protein
MGGHAFGEGEESLNDFQIVGVDTTRNDRPMRRLGIRRSKCPTFWPK